MISANTRNRIQVISIGGSDAERYFAVTSERPRNTVEARISAIPLNGRSARADTLGFEGLRWGRDTDALSSLAAAAGGGFTVGLKRWKSNLTATENANRRLFTRHDCGMPICAARDGPPQ